MKKHVVLYVLAILTTLATEVLGEDMYRVVVRSQDDAARLVEADVDPVMRIASGYLVMADYSTASALMQDGIPMQLVASGISKDELAVSMYGDLSGTHRHRVAYEEGGLKVYRVDYETLHDSAQREGLVPVSRWPVQLVYREPATFNWNSLRRGVDLDSLISLVEIDSLVSYSERIEAFYRRVSGTDSNYASADWLISKLEEFGYDSVYIDTFTEDIYGESKLCKNVVATKLGSSFPGTQIVVGAHRDAVPDCPGADDNGSGTVLTLEIARVLLDIDTDVTFVFVLFDAEEQGLLGSAAYARHAVARGDTIFYMFNSDMVGDEDNTDEAAVVWVANSDSVYAQLWADLADSLLGLTGHLSNWSACDAMPFAQIGSYVTWVHESEISSHYHSSSDSCVYLSFEYMEKLTKASLATVYAVDLEASAPALVFEYPSDAEEFVVPGDSGQVELTISCTKDGAIVPGSESIYYSINTEEYVQLPLINVSGNEYTGVLPPISCDDSIRFYCTAEEVETGVYYDVDMAHPHVLIPASQFLILFEDDFETEKPWIVHGNATRGLWERCLPQSLNFPQTPYRDFDGSSQCYVTGNDWLDDDVDSGYTALISPNFDASIGDARIRYARWFYNLYAMQDSMTVFISSNGGFNWQRVEKVGPLDESEGGWIEKEFYVSDFVIPSELTRLKFVASDLGINTCVEAAIDAVSVVWYECYQDDPPYCGDSDGNEAVDIDDIVFLISYIFSGGPSPDPPDRGDVNCSGSIDIDDVVCLIQFIFAGGNAPCDINGDEIPDC